MRHQRARPTFEAIVAAAWRIELGVSEEPYYYDHASTCDPEECKV